MNLGYIVDIGGTNIRFGVCGISYKAPFVVCATPKKKEEIISLIVKTIDELKLKYPNTRERIAISAPGLVNTNGIVEKSIYTDLENTNFKHELSKHCNCEVLIENDANFQALGCYNKKNLLYLVIGTAVGGAYIDENGLLKGSSGFAGEFGHIYVGGKEKCFCGKDGCLDSIVSGRKMIDVLGEQWWDKQEERKVDNYLKYAGKIVARSLDTLSTIFDPSEIYVCGNICKCMAFSEKLNEEWQKNIWSKCEIKILTNTWPNVYNAACMLLNN